MDSRIRTGAADALFWTNWRVQLTIPSVLEPGEEFNLRITAFDPTEMPNEGFGRRLVFEECRGIEGLPESTGFEKGCEGLITITGLKAVGPGTAWVAARPEGCPGVVKSNPAWVVESPPYRVYWGDLHVHTTYSNCSPWACKDPEFCYEYASKASHLDFAAAADHLRGIASDESRWPRLQRLVTEYDSPGTFVPFLAFESSHKSGYGGDNNVYFLNANAPYFWIDREDMKGISPEVTLRQLWDFLDATGQEYFTVPHHTGRAGKYRDFAQGDHDAARECLFEVFSAWGSSEMKAGKFPLYAGETDRPAYFRDALKLGCRYGVFASSDDHRTLPGSMSSVWSAPAGPRGLAGYSQHGLAAVRAPRLTRDEIWKALKARSCYATTFERTLLDVSVNGVGMGQVACVGDDAAIKRRREIAVRWCSSAQKSLEVTLVRNGEEIESAMSVQDQDSVLFTDSACLDDIAVRDAKHHPAPFVVYYVRLEDRLGQTQWSSPVWLDLE